MAFPDQVTVANGGELYVALIQSDVATTPTLYTLTLEATYAANATTISLTSNPAGLKLQHGRKFTLTGGRTFTVNVADDIDAQVDDIVTVAGTATAVPVIPQSSALTLATPTAQTATLYEVFKVLGLTQMSPGLQPQSVDGTDMESGFGQKNVVVGINRQIQAQGFRKRGDRAFYEIIMPYLTTDTTVQKLLWTEAYLPNGEVMAGATRITDGGQTAQVRQLLQYNLTFAFQGNAFSYTSGDTAFFVA